MARNMVRSMASKAGKGAKMLARGTSAGAGKAASMATKRATSAGRNISRNAPSIAKALSPKERAIGIRKAAHSKAKTADYMKGITSGSGGILAGLSRSEGPTRAGMHVLGKAQGHGALRTELGMTGIASSMKRATKQMGQNLSNTGWDMAKSDLARRAVRGAATGAAVGGAVSAVQGESVWEGAGRGMVTGGVLGAGVSGARMATNTRANQNVFSGALGFAESTGVSKSVTALGQMASSSRVNPLNMRR